VQSVKRSDYFLVAGAVGSRRIRLFHEAVAVDSKQALPAAEAEFLVPGFDRYDNPLPVSSLISASRFCNSPSDIASVRVTSTDRQPGRDAKVLSGNQSGMWERDQTDPPNESLIGISDARADVLPCGRFGFPGFVMLANHNNPMNPASIEIPSHRVLGRTPAKRGAPASPA
jgi:hypothetical protein